MVASLVVFLNTQLPFTVVPSGRTTQVNCYAVLIISPLNSQFSKMITPKSGITGSRTRPSKTYYTGLEPLAAGLRKTK